jgi:hypothetical protein
VPGLLPHYNNRNPALFEIQSIDPHEFDARNSTLPSGGLCKPRSGATYL